MKLLTHICAVIIFTTFTHAQASSCTVKELKDRSYEGIVKYLSENEFESIECFLHSLPEDIRAFRTYAKNSISLQSASKMNPRAIVTSPKGEFSLTFNGSENQKGFEEVEILAVDNVDAPREWRAASLRVIGKKLVAVDEKQKCSKCHGDPIRPLWNEYPEWPNLYGAREDWMPNPHSPGKDGLYYEFDFENRRVTEEIIKERLGERNDFLKFRKYAKNHPRYSALEEVSDDNNPVYPYTEQWRTRNYAFRPNLTMGSIFAGIQMKMIIARFEESRFFKAYSNSIFFYRACSSVESTKELYKDVDRRFSEEYSKLVSSIDSSLLDNTTAVVLSRLMGLKEHELTLEFKNNLYKDKKNYYSGESSVRFDFYSGSQLLLSDSILHLMNKNGVENRFNTYAEVDYYSFDDEREDIYDDDGVLIYSPLRSRSTYISKDFYREFEKMSITIDQEYDYENNTLIPVSWDAECENWSHGVKEELDRNSVEEGSDPSIWNKSYPKVVSSCIQCHEGSNRIAKEIKFSNPVEIDSGYRSELSMYILEAVLNKELKPAHLGGTRMPLGRAPLTQSEKDEVIKWIDSGK